MYTRRSPSALLCCVHVLLLLLQCSQGMIYLEEVSGALLYDESDEVMLPSDFMSHDAIVSSASILDNSTDTTMTSSPSYSTVPSSTPSLQPSTNHVFDRHLAPVLVPAFDDLEYINSDNNYIYYDSKQARFGLDLGPRGNFEVGNLLLPPRGMWGYVVVGEDDVKIGQTSTESHVVHSIDNNDTDASSISSSNQSANKSENTTIATNNQTRRRGVGERIMESIDVFLGLAEPTIETKHESLFNNTTNNTDATLLSNHINHANDSSKDTLPTWKLDNITLDQQFYISDYFCLQDFVEWKTRLQSCHEQQQVHKQDNDESYPTRMVRMDHNQTKIGNYSQQAIGVPNNATSFTAHTSCPTSIPPHPYFNQENENYINSTRPITILALRGRCPFESKAQMAMLLNEMFISRGMSNRISHIIVYNNATLKDDTKLVEMGLASQTIQEYTADIVTATTATTTSQDMETYGFDVGLLYINSQSGRDILSRMYGRAKSVGLSPYLNMNGVFLEDSYTNTSNSNVRKNRIGQGGITMEESVKGDYSDVIDTDQELYYDSTISNGWFFPATLTRFCLSCGPEQNYGYDLRIPVHDTNTSTGTQVQPWDGGWFHFGGKDPPNDQSSEDTSISRGPYDPYNGSYYIPQDWVEAVRHLMISILAVLLIAPFIFAAWRWRSVGGTIRLARDERGARRLRLIAP